MKKTARLPAGRRKNPRCSLLREVPRVDYSTLAALAIAVNLLITVVVMGGWLHNPEQ
jgi:hypothetical protein